MDVLKPPAEKLLVCVGPSASSANLINSAKKIAASLNAKWFAVYVEPGRIRPRRQGSKRKMVCGIRRDTQDAHVAGSGA